MAVTSLPSSGASALGNGIMESIPHELHSHILSYLDVTTLAKMTQVSTYWQSMGSADALWRCFWDKYHITDMTADLPTKIAMQEFVCAKVESWEAFLQKEGISNLLDILRPVRLCEFMPPIFSCDEVWSSMQSSCQIPRANAKSDGKRLQHKFPQTDWEQYKIKGKSSLQKYALIRERAPEFLKYVLQMSDPHDDLMRADFFFHYLEAGLPITPIISDGKAIFDIHRCYDGDMPMYFTLATFLLNVRQNNLDPLIEFCNLRAKRNRTALTERPERYVAGCDPHFLLMFEFTNAVFFSNGASFSELFKCPAFNPNFSLPKWTTFARGSSNSLEAKTSKMTPFLSAFILHFFRLPAISKVNFNTHHFSAAKERIRSVQFDFSAYASRKLPFEITPQAITHEQLYKDLEVLAHHPHIDLKATDYQGLTALELVKKMKDHYASSSQDVFSQGKLEILDRVFPILERAQEVKDKESTCPQ